jgi:protein TonB
VTNKAAGKPMRIGGMLDARGPRALLCVLLAVAIWLGFAVGFVRGLWRVDDQVKAPRPVAFDVRLVRLPPPEPPPSRAAQQPSPSAQQPQRPASERALQALRVPRTPAATAAQTSLAHAARRSAAPALSAPTSTPPSRDVPQPAAPTVLTAPVAPDTQHTPLTPQTPSAPPAAQAPPAAPSAAAAAAAPAEPAPSAQTPARSATQDSSSSAGNGTAHPILQPLPSLPDDLREDAFQAVATARFSVHRDGSVDVELIKPTHNPRLNQLLLDALKKWRFFPAMKNGEAVESTQDIRVHFNVD